MKPLTSRQWRTIGNWAVFTTLWNILFIAWFGMTQQWTAAWIVLATLVVSLWLMHRSFRREDEILRNLIYYSGERVSQVAIRDAWGSVWVLDQVTTWDELKDRLREQVGEDVPINMEFGYSTTHRDFITPEQAAFVARYSRQAIPIPRSGYGLEPSELVGTAFRP